VKRSDDEQEDEPPSGGLLYGINCWHIRILCDNPMDGGRGYTPEQVGALTIDQVLMLLTDRKLLCNRSKSLSSLEVMSTVGTKDGRICARDVNDNLIQGQIRGKSKARELMEAEAKRKGEKSRKPRRSRRIGRA